MKEQKEEENQTNFEEISHPDSSRLLEALKDDQNKRQTATAASMGVGTATVAATNISATTNPAATTAADATADSLQLSQSRIDQINDSLITGEAFLFSERMSSGCIFVPEMLEAADHNGGGISSKEEEEEDRKRKERKREEEGKKEEQQGQGGKNDENAKKSKTVLSPSERKRRMHLRKVYSEIMKKESEANPAEDIVDRFANMTVTEFRRHLETLEEYRKSLRKRTSLLAEELEALRKRKRKEVVEQIEKNFPAVVKKQRRIEMTRGGGGGGGGGGEDSETKPAAPSTGFKRLFKMLKPKQQNTILNSAIVQRLQEEEVRLEMQIGVLEMEEEEAEGKSKKCQFFVEQEILKERLDIFADE